MKRPSQNQRGFTLIESVVAIGVLSIGVIALYTLQTISIRGNGSAQRITQEATWGGDQLERLLAADWDSISVSDRDGDGTNQDANGDGVDDDGGNFGLDDTDCCQDGNDPQGNAVAGCVNRADRCVAQGNNNIYINVAEDQPIADLKRIRVTVVRPDQGANRLVVFDYIKAKM